MTQIPQSIPVKNKFTLRLGSSLKLWVRSASPKAHGLHKERAISITKSELE